MEEIEEEKQPHEERLEVDVNVDYDIAQSPNFHLVRAGEHARRTYQYDDQAILEISTKFNGGKAQNGGMFDIRSLPNNVIKIDSLAFHTLDEVDECNVQIFTKQGSHEYFEEESSAWKRIISTTTICKGPGKITRVALRGAVLNKDDIIVDRSQRRAFYIRVIDTQIIYSVTDKQNKVFAEDEHVQIFSGVAIGGFFKDFWSPRMLNVAVSYTVERMWNGSVGIPTSAFGADIGDEVCKKTLNVITSDSVNSNYGIMFNVQSTSDSDTSVYGLGFYVHMTSSIQYEIYALKGGFEHGSATLSLWTKIAQGIKKDVNKGSLIMISGSDFAPVKVSPGDTFGFYITLSTENLRYHSTSVTLGHTYMQNNDISVSVGAGVSGYPLSEVTKFLSRRALYGQVLYGKVEECGPEATVDYFFLVQYPMDWSSSDMRNVINGELQVIIQDLIDSDEHLRAFQRNFKLEVASVFSKDHLSSSGTIPSIFILHGRHYLLLLTIK